MLINLRNALMTGGSVPTPAYWGLCFTAETAGAKVSMINGTGTVPEITLQTSRDGRIWTPYTIGDVITLQSVGDFVYFAAGENGNRQIADNSNSTRRIVVDGYVSASGDITSLLDSVAPVTNLINRNHAFCRLFQGCTGLTSAPELNATRLSQGCYQYMFYKCVDLLAAPALPAARTARSAYESMFKECASIRYAEMSATTTNYAAAQRQMFEFCASLSDITVHTKTWGTLASSFGLWVQGVAPTGTFRCPAALGTNETIARGNDRCPEGWTVVNI